MESNWDKIISESQLISLPEVYLKLQQIINDDDYSLPEITEAISLDPAICARLLRMVNSSFFGLTSKIDNINQAVNYLGSQQVHDLVLSTSLAQTFNELNNPDFRLHDFWLNSVYCALTARELALICNSQACERLFLAGLLHDIGHLMMYQSLPDLTTQARNTATEDQIPLYQSERQLIGFDFAAVGAELLKKWNLPDSLTVAIKHQIEPKNSEQESDITEILNLAGSITKSYEQGLSSEELSLFNLDKNILYNLGINLDLCITIDRTVRDNINSVLGLLFPQYLNQQ